MSDLSSFSIQNPKQISSHLFLLFKHKCLLSARFGQNNESYITTLLGINEKNNVMVLDYGPKEYLNHHIVNAGNVTFETEYRGIKVAFTGAELKKITHNGYPAFSIPIPKILFWQERRDYYRAKVPISNASYCQLSFEDREPINLQLHDISLSGFSMLNDGKENFDLFVPGTSFEHCKLMLSDAGEVSFSLEVCFDHIINADKLQKIQKIGCKFVKTTRSAEEAVQRYMQRIQREELQKNIKLH